MSCYWQRYENMKFESRLGSSLQFIVYLYLSRTAIWSTNLAKIEEKVNHGVSRQILFSGAFYGGQIFFRSKGHGRHVSDSTFSYLHCTLNISLNWNTIRLPTLKIWLCQWVEESWSFRKFGHASILPVKSHWTINMLITTHIWTTWTGIHMACAKSTICAVCVGTTWWRTTTGTTGGDPDVDTDSAETGGTNCGRSDGGAGALDWRYINKPVRGTRSMIMLDGSDKKIVSS